MMKYVFNIACGLLLIMACQQSPAQLPPPQRHREVKPHHEKPQKEKHRVRKASVTWNRDANTSLQSVKIEAEQIHASGSSLAWVDEKSVITVTFDMKKYVHITGFSDPHELYCHPARKKLFFVSEDAVWSYTKAKGKLAKVLEMKGISSGGAYLGGFGERLIIYGRENSTFKLYSLDLTNMNKTQVFSARSGITNLVTTQTAIVFEHDNAIYRYPY